jgi:nucleotide-binding universal stress UspA family protein
MTPRATADSNDARVQNVLVPLDGSEFALAAMPTARALAERFGADLHIVSVVGDEDDPSRLGALGSAALGVAVGDERVAVIEGGSVVDGITGRAEALGDCVVCVSTHGRGRLSGAVIGSVARELVQRSTAPVVVLGPLADRPGWYPSPRWAAPLTVPRIVACVDGSDTS